MYAVGGLFHYTDNTGAFLSGVMKVQLNNGDVFVRSIDSASTFTGFESDGDSILSLQLSHFQTTPINFAAVQSLLIGYVPAPGMTAFLFMIGIATTRRRRNEHSAAVLAAKNV